MSKPQQESTVNARMAERSIHNNQQQTKKQRKKKDKEEIDEPKVQWRKSNAKSLLVKDIMEGRVPLEAKDENGESTMPLVDIYAMHPEHAAYHYSKFSRPLSRREVSFIKLAS
jgi:hypothetical protein